MDPILEGSLRLEDGQTLISVEEMNKPGFLRCEVFATLDGKEYRGLGTVAFELEKIQPTVAMPDDFEVFWAAGKEDLAQIPIDPEMIHLPERSTSKVDVYHVNFQNIKNSRIDGILTVPKAEGKYPAILQVPSAGIRPCNGDVA